MSIFKNSYSWCPKKQLKYLSSLQSINSLIHRCIIAGAAFEFLSSGPHGCILGKMFDMNI